MTPALAGRFFTTEPPGKPYEFSFFFKKSFPHVSEIMQCLSFCDWLVSFKMPFKFHTCANDRILFFF